MAVITTLTNNEVVKEFWEEKFLTELRENLVFYNLGKMTDVPAHEGDIAHWMNVRDLDEPSAALTEGTDPSTTNASTVDTTAQLEQWGQLVTMSDLQQKHAVSALGASIVDRLRFSAQRTYDSKTLRTIFTAGGTAQYGGSASFRNSIADDASFDFDTTEIRKAVRTLQNNDVIPHPRAMGGAEYVGVASPEAIFDVQGDSHWREIVVNTDKNVDMITKGTVGELYDVSFLRTSRLASGSNYVPLSNSGSAGTDVMQTYILGGEYFGIADFDALELVMNPRSPRSALGLYGDFGWKFSTACKELDSSRMVRIETSTSKETRSA